MLSNSAEHENVISEDRKNNHNIKRYSFRPIIIKPQAEKEEGATASTQVQAAQAATQAEEPQEEQQGGQVENNQEVLPPQAISFFETEVVDKILQKSDTLAQSLQSLQERFDKQESEFSQKYAEAQNSGKEQGYKDGYEAAKKELDSQVQAQKELYKESIQKLQQAIETTQKNAQNLEKELSSIALDIAQEVILIEVDEKSSKIATALARSLLQSVAQSAQKTLKVAPEDYTSLKEIFADDKSIKIESERAISKGGVVVMSESGNIDGDIRLRFEMLKKSVLEGSKETNE